MSAFINLLVISFVLNAGVALAADGVSDAEKLRRFEVAVAEKMQAQANEWNALSDREKIARMQQAVAKEVDWKAMTDAEKKAWRIAAAKNAQLSDAERVQQIETAIATKLKQQAKEWEKLTDAEKLAKLEAQLHQPK